MRPAIANTNIKRERPPQNGAVTHHQDQLIIPPNFRPINKTPNKPKIPIPLDELELFDIKDSFQRGGEGRGCETPPLVGLPIKGHEKKNRGRGKLKLNGTVARPKTNEVPLPLIF